MSLTDKLRIKMHLLQSSLPGAKGRFEMDYWKKKFQEEGGTLKNEHYRYLFVDYWGFEPSFYEGKRVLDIGCGPRGSLEWADMAAERVGLDPIVDKYRALGIEKHKMTYCHSPVETMPYEDGHFDVVASINSLDHVDDVDAAIAELKRVTKPGGHLLLMVEVNHDPTVCEPHALDWDLPKRFEPEFEVVRENHYEHGAPSMEEVLKGPAYDHANPQARTGTLAAKFRRV
jgi:ubiquinone/menaquinone biosynthesis C-methylase UbiE